MYMSELLVREQQSERLKQASADRLSQQAAELRRLRGIQQRAERRLRRIRLRASELRSAIGTGS
jgi:hypothetical protein